MSKFLARISRSLVARSSTSFECPLLTFVLFPLLSCFRFVFRFFAFVFRASCFAFPAWFFHSAPFAVLHAVLLDAASSRKGPRAPIEVPNTNNPARTARRPAASTPATAAAGREGAGVIAAYYRGVGEIHLHTILIRQTTTTASVTSVTVPPWVPHSRSLSAV